MEVAINYLAVLIAAAVIMGTGALWYGPLFGRQWMKLKGYTKESVAQMKMSPQKAMLYAAVSALVSAFVLSLLVNMLPPKGIPGAFMLTLLVWTGFIAATHVHSVLFEEGSVRLFLFNMAQYFVAFFLAACVIVLL